MVNWSKSVKTINTIDGDLIVNLAWALFPSGDSGLVQWADILNTPTTLAGYGIDADINDLDDVSLNDTGGLTFWDGDSLETSPDMVYNGTTLDIDCEVDFNDDVTFATDIDVEGVLKYDPADIGTPDAGDKVLIVDISDPENPVKYVDWSDLPGTGSGDAWSDPVDSDIVPTGASGTYDLGSMSDRFADAWFTSRVYVSNTIYADAGILDNYTDNYVAFAAAGSAGANVNYIKFSSHDTGNPPKAESDGSDTNIDFELDAKGTGVISALSDISLDDSIQLLLGDSDDVAIYYDGATNELKFNAASTSNDFVFEHSGVDVFKITNTQMITDVDELYFNGFGGISEDGTYIIFGDIQADDITARLDGWGGSSRIEMGDGDITITGETTYEDDVHLKDGKELYFGTGDDVALEYDTGSDEFWIQTTDVDVDIKMRTLAGSDKFTFDMGTAEATAVDWTATSDERLKEDWAIFREEGVLDLVMSLQNNFKTFTWMETGKRDVGYAAQVIQEFFPELVGETGNYLTLKYSKLSGIALEAIAEESSRAQTRERELELRIEELEEEIIKLKRF